MSLMRPVTFEPNNIGLQQSHHPPSLALVHYGLLRAAPSLAALSHVVDLFTEFLDVTPLYTPAHAAATGSFRLFQRTMTEYEAMENNIERSYWCAQALEVAIYQNDLALVQQIHSVHPGRLLVRSLALALT